MNYYGNRINHIFNENLPLLFQYIYHTPLLGSTPLTETINLFELTGAVFWFILLSYGWIPFIFYVLANGCLIYLGLLLIPTRKGKYKELIKLFMIYFIIENIFSIIASFFGIFSWYTFITSYVSEIYMIILLANYLLLTHK